LPLALLAGIAIGQALTSAKNRPTIVRLALLTLGLVAGFEAVNQTILSWRTRETLHQWEAFDADRRLAGIFLREHAAPYEAVASAYGWPAFESKLPFIDRSDLNGAGPSIAASYRVEHGTPYSAGNVPPLEPDGMIPLATFNLASSIFPGVSWFVIYGRQDSEIARANTRALRYRLRELTLVDNPAQESTVLGANDLHVAAGAGLTYRLPTVGGPFAVLFNVQRLESGAGRPFLSIEADDRVVWRETPGGLPDAERVCVSLGPSAIAGSTVRFATTGTGEGVFKDVEIRSGPLHVAPSPLGDVFERAWHSHDIPSESCWRTGG
jgi:hypothetical protein